MTALILVAMFTASCAQAPISPKNVDLVLPHVKPYTKAQTSAAADELETCVEPKNTEMLLLDYHIMRNETRIAEKKLK